MLADPGSPTQRAIKRLCVCVCVCVCVDDTLMIVNETDKELLCVAPLKSCLPSYGLL